MKNQKTTTQIVVDLIIRIGILLILIVWCFQILAPFLNPVLWGMLIAVALYPLFSWVSKKLRGADKLSAISQQAAMLGQDFTSFPLLMTMNMSQMGMNMTITHEVTDIKEESVSEDKFDMTPPEGYEQTDQLMGM